VLSKCLALPTVINHNKTRDAPKTNKFCLLVSCFSAFCHLCNKKKDEEEERKVIYMQYFKVARG